MPWKEPGNSSNNKDPWTGRPKKTPPDLEAFLRELLKKITAFFKVKAANRNTIIFTKTFLPMRLNAKNLGFFISLILLMWIFSGFFTVDPYQQAVITRFGKYSSTLAPGHHWIFRPIESSYIVSERNKPYSYQMDLLTSDKNKVSVGATVHFTIANARQYLFANKYPLQSLEEAIANVTTQTLSQFSLQQLLTVNHFGLQQTLQVQLDKLLAKYTTGLIVNDIELQSIQVPEELKAPFEDVKNAHLEKTELENQAKNYAMQTQPEAKGNSERLIADAKTYQQEVILNAKAETTRFLDLLPAYNASPQLTRKRLYLETMQAIMANSNKMLINNQANTSLYLNIDKALIPNYQEKVSEVTIKKSSSPENKSTFDIKAPSKNNTDQKLPSSYDIIGGYE